MTNITLEPSSEAEAMSNVASGIATSLSLVEGAYHQGRWYIFISLKNNALGIQKLRGGCNIILFIEASKKNGRKCNRTDDFLQEL
jgi:hypothetical protein